MTISRPPASPESPEHWFVWNHNRERFHLDRRNRGLYPGGDFAEMRTRETIFVAPFQLDYLHSHLVQLRDSAAAVKRSSRRLKNVVFFLAVLHIGLAGLDGNPEFDISFAGTSVKISLSQISLVFPIVMGFLILYATRLSSSNLRLTHAERLLASFIDKFGCPTGTTITRFYGECCKKDKSAVPNLLYRMSRMAVDLFVGLFVVISIVLAISSSLNDGMENRWWYGGLIALAAVLVLGGPIAFQYGKKAISKSLDEVADNPEHAADIVKLILGGGAG